jgi:indolepyruvate ferredoxin oxidoreductase beta subunit
MPLAGLKRRIFITGVGGQGSLTASRILGEAAMGAGYPVLVGEIHGMSQRGGVVESTVVIGDVRSPIIEDGTADLLVAFEPLEALRAARKANARTVMVVNTRMVVPTTVSRGQASYPSIEQGIQDLRQALAAVIAFDATELALSAGSAMATNMVLLGAAAQTGLLPLSPEELLAALVQRSPGRWRTINIRAFELGLGMGTDRGTAPELMAGASTSSATH